ncbi:ferredoxin-fold anticodon-binding domain-containing protein 1 [Aplochiton taeniatus]
MSSLTILLVGEGNFSYSAALSRSYPGRNEITATCLHNQEEALRHQGCSDNIQAIKDRGGKVLFEVDSTRLGECASLQGNIFDRVIFNFPHYGRKSGVKKNRQLLKQFFLSCVQLLSKEGEVHVALCNGQGGTPADQPMREWHNSWQVVAMASEACLMLSDVRTFEDGTFDSYKCTGYRSQDKGFHVEKALLHVFTRSLPYSPLLPLQVKEDVEGQGMYYYIPAELSDYIHREFLSPSSVHPIRLVQDFLLKGLAEKYYLSMVTESLPLLLTSKQLQTCCPEIDNKYCYWINPIHTVPTMYSPCNTDIDSVKDTLTSSLDTITDNLSKTHLTSRIDDGVEDRWNKDLWSKASQEVDGVLEGGIDKACLLRPCLQPQMQELLNQEQRKTGHSVRGDGVGGEGSCGSGRAVKDQTEGPCGGLSGTVAGVSGLVFRRVPIQPWSTPAYHQLLLRGVFPAESEPIKLICQCLENLLAPFKVSLTLEEGDLCLTAQPMGLLGLVSSSDVTDDLTHVCVSVSLNLDLLAVLLFSLPDWRMLWSCDTRFLKQFVHCPSPGQPFCAFSLYPQFFSFDISFWASRTWEESGFHAVVREASRGTVVRVKLIDTFSHPDLSQTSYCYRLIYHSHTHALSHTQALKLHSFLQTLLSKRLQVTIR